MTPGVAEDINTSGSSGHDGLREEALAQNREATAMVQVQGGQDISSGKSRTTEAERVTLGDLWSVNVKEPGDHLDVGNGKERGSG